MTMLGEESPYLAKVMTLNMITFSCNNFPIAQTEHVEKNKRRV